MQASLPQKTSVSSFARTNAAARVPVTCSWNVFNTSQKLERRVAQRKRVSVLASANAAPQQQQVADSPSPPLRTLHPPPQPQGAYDIGQLQVSDVHTIHYYQYGNPQGLPAVFLHGGPGAAAWPNHARFFDLRVWRVVLLDQRGCGASTPRGCLIDNTTEALVSDLEKLRAHLGIASWLVLGGSWGVALGLAYASAHPTRVTGLVLRGICLMRPQEIDWMYKAGGASILKPIAWANFVEGLPEEMRQGDVLSGYLQLLTSPDAATRDNAARNWMHWGFAVGGGSSKAALIWDGNSWSWNQHPLTQIPANWGQRPRPDPQPLQALQQQHHEEHQRAGGDQPLKHKSLNGQNRSSAVLQQDANAARTSAAQKSSSSSSNGAGKPRTTPQARAKHQPLPKTGRGSSRDQGRGSDEALLTDDLLSAQRLNVLSSALTFPGDNNMPSTTAQALLECAYSAAYAFSLHHHPLLAPDRIASLQAHGVRCIAIHGEADLICPPVTVWDLHRAWPQMQVMVVPGAGHSQYDPRITHELVCAVESIQRDMLGY
mmetsp:Transcript_28088/g.72201  ORF Transcript_28088/g.72201 Transcript_28088/m.72201 type:complete len:543 (+) Transcript_28088:24-1652(+)